MSIRHLVAVALGIITLTGACASDDDDDAGAPSTSAPTAASSSTSTAPSSSTTDAPAKPLTIDWTADFETPLPNGWTVRACEGGRTNVCVHEGSTFLGDIELLGPYPPSAEDADAEPQAVAVRWAKDMIDHFRADRAKGCADFTFTSLGATEVVVAGRPGARGGFTLADAEGRVVEQVVNHYTVVDGGIMIINTDAYALEGGCLGPSETDASFTPERLAALDRGLLDRIVETAPATAG